MRALLGLLPREAVRSMYRRSCSERPVEDDSEPDPLNLLLRFCESILPLPPFDVWLEDFRDHPRSHLDDMDQSAEAPSSSSPATLETRRLVRDTDQWIVRLRGFRDEGAWRGYIAFEERASGSVHRTSLIFRERDAWDLRERFLGFRPATLEAFLRSSLP